MDKKTGEQFNYFTSIRLTTMASIQTHQDLQDAIQNLERKQLMDKEHMKSYFQDARENIEPLNIIKSTLHSINSSDELKKDMIKTAVALAIGYIAKKVVNAYLNKTRTKTSFGVENLIQIAISGLIGGNFAFIKNIAMNFFRLILQKRQNQLLLNAHQ